MCYYISITPRHSDLELRFGSLFEHSESFQPAYSASAFSYPFIPVVTNERPHYIQFLQWGLIPFWVKDWIVAQKIRQRTLNARSETIFEKSSFRHSIRSKRCLIPADGFFEWRHENKKKYPYYIKLKDHTLFAIAGIWDTWTNPETEDKLNTFSVITTQANEIMAKVHNSRKRMPLILPQNRETEWLDLKADESTIKDMMKPYVTADLEAYPVENKINRLGYNVTDKTVIDFFDYPELPALD